jgi:hypothetical protein
MSRENVESSMAKSIGFSLKTLTLEIEFHTGEVWQYIGISEQMYHEMMDTSIGKYFQKNIKGKFEEKRVQ